LDFEIATQERLYLAAQGNRRAMHAIFASSRWKVESIGALVAWPNDPSRSWALGFLAGIFDAEVSFSQAGWRISNRAPEILEWRQRCLRMMGFTFVIEHLPDTGRRPIDVVRLTGGLREHLRFFHTGRPAITRKLNLEGQAIKSDAKLKVVSIEPLGRAMRMFD